MSAARPLITQLPIGARVKLTGIAGGRQLTAKLRSLGLTIGSEMEVLHHRGRGVVVGKDGNRVALGGGVAEKLQIEALD